MPWNPAVLEQRIGRIHRLGQKHPIEVYHLITEGGIEARIVDLVGDKRALFTGLFDGASDEVHFESSGSFLSRAIRLVAEAPVEEAAGAEGSEAAESAAEALLEAEDMASPASLAAPDLVDTPLPIAPEAPLPPFSGSAHAAARASATATDVGAILPRISVRPLPGGGISLEAPPEAAAALASLLLGLAQQISAAVQPSIVREG
jgi:hypothetical protein